MKYLFLFLFLSTKASAAYEFPGFPWHAKRSQVQTILLAKGVQTTEVSGEQEECLPDYQTGFGYHAIYPFKNRGTRIRAPYLFEGEKFQVDFIFRSERLIQVQLRRDWLRGEKPESIRDAQRMIHSSHHIANELQRSYSLPDDTQWDEDWIDTARWYRKKPANINLYLRGEEGFLFSPSYRSCLGIVFSSEEMEELPYQGPLFAR
jgi:hypothetical protein